jgi:predicted RecA/RadA family phage recombinase
MKNFISEGQSIPMLVTSSTISGLCYIVNDIALIAQASIVATAQSPQICPMLTYGCIELPKSSGMVIQAGQQAYWDNTAKVVTKTASGNKRVGYFVLDAAAGETLARLYFYALS